MFFQIDMLVAFFGPAVVSYDLGRRNARRQFGSGELQRDRIVRYLTEIEQLDEFLQSQSLHALLVHVDYVDLQQRIEVLRQIGGLKAIRDFHVQTLHTLNNDRHVELVLEKVPLQIGAVLQNENVNALNWFGELLRFGARLQIFDERSSAVLDLISVLVLPDGLARVVSVFVGDSLEFALAVLQVLVLARTAVRTGVRLDDGVIVDQHTVAVKPFETVIALNPSYVAHTVRSMRRRRRR